MSAPVTYLDDLFAGYPETLTVEQCRVLLGQDNVVTIYRWLDRNLIPGWKFGRTWVIYRDELKAHMEAERAAREAARVEDDPQE